MSVIHNLGLLVLICIFIENVEKGLAPAADSGEGWVVLCLPLVVFGARREAAGRPGSPAEGKRLDLLPSLI